MIKAQLFNLLTDFWVCPQLFHIIEGDVDVGLDSKADEWLKLLRNEPM